LLSKVEQEFPDLQNLQDVLSFSNRTSSKHASKGFKDISASGTKLIAFLNSDVFLNYLSCLTGIEEPLISDPYLQGGGYHQINNGGVLKTHIDYAKHPKMGLDRRVNLLLYLNKDWETSWGGSLCLFDKENLIKPAVKVSPIFNRCVIFSTTSFSYHGHPGLVKCPAGITRRSLALYYFSNGRPSEEVSDQSKQDPTQTFWIDDKGKSISNTLFRRVIVKLLPPLVLDIVRKIRQAR